MKDETLPGDESIPATGAAVAMTLRVIDAGLRTLQGLRHRIEAPAPDESSGDNRRRDSTTVDAQPAAVEPPRRKTLLHRALIVLMCLLIGAVVGMLFSYRGFSRTLDARGSMIESLQEEISQARKDEARSLNAKAKYQNDLGEYRKHLREARQEIEDYKGQVEDLKARLAAFQPVTRPTPAAGRSTSRAPQKTGTCVTGTANLADKLSTCIDKFNRP